MHGDLKCAVCGRPVARGGPAGGYGHRSRGVVAACDLDSDHAAVPDWRAAGELICGICNGEIAADSGNRLTHVDGEDDHEPEPVIG